MNVGDTVFWTLMAVLTPLSVGSFAVVVWWMVHQRGSDANTDRIGEIWQHRDAWGEDACRQLIQRQVANGMTPEMVELAWGQPRATQPSGDTLRWLYADESLAQSRNSVTFKDGQVVEVMGEAPRIQSWVGPWLVIGISLGVSLLVTVLALLVVYLV